MSINLTKNKAQILDAWTKVSKNEDGYDWALFSYEGKSYELKVEAIGSGGIESICEEFNDGKIQYAFVRVKDPNTQLIKFILINFQGEAVLDLVHKGTCANHIKDVSRLLKNHLTITATNVDDLEEDIIMSKISKITSEYDFQSRTVPTDEKFKVGTNYERVIPTREINVVKRDEFWRKEEEIEKARVAGEQEAKKAENLLLEEKRAKREQSEHSKRELMNKDASIEKKDIVAPPKPVSPMKPVDREESTRPKAEEMRADRRREAQELIGNRVNTAKAMWQQQAAQNSTPVKAAPPQKPIRKTIPKIEPEIEQQQQPEAQVEIDPQPQQVVEKVTKQVESLQFSEDEQFSTIKRSPKTPDKGDNGFIVPAVVTDNEEHVTSKIEIEQTQEQFQQIEDEEEAFRKLKALEKQQKELEEAQRQLETISQDLQQQEQVEEDAPMLKAVALYDYQAVDDTEINFDPGDIITHIDQIDEGWWQGYSERFGTYGLFPANYVELIN